MKWYYFLPFERPICYSLGSNILKHVSTCHFEIISRHLCHVRACISFWRTSKIDPSTFHNPLSQFIKAFPCCQECLHMVIKNANKITLFSSPEVWNVKDNVNWLFHIHVLLRLFSLAGSIYPLKLQCIHLRKNETLGVNSKKEMDLEYMCHNLSFSKGKIYTKYVKSFLGLKMMFSLYLCPTLSWRST